MKQTQLTIIGAGPIGLEAALQASEAGFEVTLFEQATVAQNLQNWGHVKLFTPFEMNTSTQGIQLLQNAGYELPAGDAILTGKQFVEKYLEPLSTQLKKKIKLCENCKVVLISRGDFLKGEAIGKRDAQQKFRLLVESNHQEKIATADFVLDCSGVYPHHNWLGNGGIPCPGERSLAGKIEYQLPDLSTESANKYSSKSTLVIGSGYSAATTICKLAKMTDRHPETNIIWATRSDDSQGPISSTKNDPLVGRHLLAKQANQFATGKLSGIHWLAGFAVEHLQPHAESEKMIVTLRCLKNSASKSQQIEVDYIIAQVGYRPNRTLYEELQIHECYASAGIMKMAASLLTQQGADCLTISAGGVETLKNPEPGFFVLGSKSYGRNNQFLMQTGYEHIKQVIEFLASKKITS